MGRRFETTRHARQRMEQWGITAQEVAQVYRHPDSVGISYQTGRELRSAEIGGRLVTLVIETGRDVATVWTAWADIGPDEDGP